MNCKDCVYWYQSPEDDFPCCQFKGPDGTAPCEYDEDFSEDLEEYEENS